MELVLRYAWEVIKSIPLYCSVMLKDVT